jgi:HlyD family secretion protein
VAGVGDLRRLRVRVYVDEPELGRVGVGMPVTVTWDALPGRQWRGAVERMPTQVTPAGTRQVGEVLCTIDNPDLKLLPGTNVNVEITSQVVTGGLTIPKEALRNTSGQVGVYALDGDRVRWRPIQLGASSVTRAVVLSGLNAGDRVALPADKLLHDGDAVRVTR